MGIATFSKKSILVLVLAALGAILIIKLYYFPDVRGLSGSDNDVKSGNFDLLHNPRVRFDDSVKSTQIVTIKQTAADSLSEGIVNGVKNVVPTSVTSKPKFDLSQDIIERVEKFVFFIGYPRSGHSIVGSFMDAHPHMVIAHEFTLFRKLRELNLKQEMDKIALLHNKSYLFNSLYHASVRDSMMGWRSKSSDSKNYTLSVDSPWVGKYNDYISVIGDKCGGITSNTYSESPGGFTAHYRQLKRTVGIPIKVFHCVRNPYDMVSTNTLYKMGYVVHPRDPYKFVSVYKANMSKLQGEKFMKARYNNAGMLEERFNLLESQANAVTKITDLVGSDNVLELHNGELVNDPKSALIKICAFLEVECSDEYLQACSEKVFKSVSKSRELVVWPQRLRNRMESLIHRYPFFHRYSFDGV